MKTVNSSVRIIKIALLLLMPITPMAIPILFLKLETTTSTDDDRVYIKTVFDEKLFKKSHFDSVLMGILTASAAIVAISFTITQIIISNISQKYSPKILEIYIQKSSPYVAFVTLILTTSGAASLLFLYHIIMPQLVAVFTPVLMVIFLISLYLFTNNLKLIFHIISPYYIMEDIKEMVLKNMVDD